MCECCGGDCKLCEKDIEKELEKEVAFQRKICSNLLDHIIYMQEKDIYDAMRKEIESIHVQLYNLREILRGDDE